MCNFNWWTNQWPEASGSDGHWADWVLVWGWLLVELRGMLLGWIGLLLHVTLVFLWLHSSSTVKIQHVRLSHNDSMNVSQVGLNTSRHTRCLLVSFQYEAAFMRRSVFNNLQSCLTIVYWWNLKWIRSFERLKKETSLWYLNLWMFV